jgi:hypothetical protein
MIRNILAQRFHHMRGILLVPNRSFKESEMEIVTSHDPNKWLQRKLYELQIGSFLKSEFKTQFLKITVKGP